MGEAGVLVSGAVCYPPVYEFGCALFNFYRADANEN